MALYNERGNIRVTVSDTSLPFGVYAADGSLRITSVDGTTVTGLYAADGSYNVVTVDATDTPVSIFDPCGALRGVAASSETGLSAPNGAIYMDGLATTAVLALVEDGLEEPSPFYSLSSSQAGTLTWDFHSVSSPSPAAGAGDIGTGTQVISSGITVLEINLSAYIGETGYLHFRMGDSNILVSQVITVFSPLSFFAASEGGGWYRADLGTNSVSLWEDQTANGNDLTQATGANQFALTTGLNGKACYLQGRGNTDFFNIPAGVSMSRRSHTWWMVIRARHIQKFGGTNGLLSLNSGLTDCATMLNSSTVIGAITIYGTTLQAETGASYSTDLALIVCRCNATNVRFAVNNRSFTLASPLAVGTMTGGRLWARTDGYCASGEGYEFGIIDRVLTDDEVASLQAYAQAQYERTWPTYGNIIIFGDSLTEGQEATTNVSWPRLLDDDIGDTYRQLSFAQSGAYLSDYSANASKYLQAYNGSFTKNIAVILLGINDIGRGDSAATITANYQTLVTALTGAGFSVVACTIAPSNAAGWTAGKETVRTTVNTNITTGVITGLTSYVDIATLPEIDDPNDTTYYQVDKLHWNNVTFPYVKDAIKTAVLAV